MKENIGGWIAIVLTNTRNSLLDQMRTRQSTRMNGTIVKPKKMFCYAYYLHLYA